MFAAIIDNGSTWLLDIRDDVEIDLERLREEWSKRYVGWLVNTNSMSDIIWGIPVSRFILKKHDNELADISVKQAHALYEMLANSRKEQEEKAIKNKF